MKKSIAWIAAATALLVGASPVRADIFTCRNGDGDLSIQDKPCHGAAKQKVYKDLPSSRRQASTASPGRKQTRNGNSPAATASEKRGIEIGMTAPGNREVICNLLGQERRDAEAQMAGKAKPLPGENPADNLAKINKQRERVGCTV